MSESTNAYFYPPKNLTVKQVEKKIDKHWDAFVVRERKVTEKEANVLPFKEFDTMLALCIFELNLEESQSILKRISNDLGVEVHTLDFGISVDVL